MHRSVQTQHRIWGHALFAAALLLLGPTLLAAISWMTGSGRDPDMAGGVFELVTFLLMIGAIPVMLLSFGVMAPLAVAIDRVAAGRASLPLIVVSGIVVGLVGLAAFALGSSLMVWQQGESFQQMAFRAFGVRPEAAAVSAMFFTVAGMTITAGMRRRTRTA
jgi:hypothetical protein